MSTRAWVLGLLLVLAIGPASAVVIHRYIPAITHPGGEVVLFGSGFGSWGDRRWKHVRIGRGLNTLAVLEGSAIPRWTPNAIGIRLPQDLAPGVYWVGIYDRLGRLISNRTPALRVERRQAVGAR